jgi:hypothetical protein
MISREIRLLRRLLAAVALLASLALAGCGGRPVSLHFNNDDTSSAFSGWGSGWGGNRDWGEGGVGGH